MPEPTLREIDEALEGLGTTALRIKSQRDELLAALKTLLSSVVANDPYAHPAEVTMSQAAAVGQARLAIARAEGR